MMVIVITRRMMNTKLMLEKTVDLLMNLAVVSVGVSVFEGVWYGLPVALFSYLVGLVICSRIGGQS